MDLEGYPNAEHIERIAALDTYHAECFRRRGSTGHKKLKELPLVRIERKISDQEIHQDSPSVDH